MLREIALGVVVGMVALGLPLACGGAGVTPLVRCKLEALRILPDDPAMVTVYDVADIVERVRACRRTESDGGP
jgi:hypothetical protein